MVSSGLKVPSGYPEIAPTSISFSILSSAQCPSTSENQKQMQLMLKPVQVRRAKLKTHLSVSQ